MNNLSDIAKQLSRDAAKATETTILEQLNDFVSRGLIELKMGPQVITQDMYSNKLNIGQTVSLVLKDKEYIEKLETENKQLKELIKKMKEVVV
jgi:DNA-binding HxlR family transcriptional regulator